MSGLSVGSEGRESKKETNLKKITPKDVAESSPEYLPEHAVACVCVSVVCERERKCSSPVALDRVKSFDGVHNLTTP